MRIAIYARRSEEKETGESIKNQILICNRYVSTYYPNASVVDEYFDDDYSGRNMHRPEFEKILKLTKKGFYDALVFWKLDRVSRNALEFLQLQKQLEDLNVNLISVTEGFDPSTPAGKLMMTMLASIAEMERKNISLRVATNMNEMAKAGRWTGGRVPFGYSVNIIDGKKYLVQNESEFAIVKSMFDKYFECESLFATSKWLKSTYSINKPATTIKRMLENLLYVKSDEDIKSYLSSKNITLYGDINGLGLISYNKVDKTKDIGVEYRNESDWIIAIGKHPGIITGKDYIKIQTILKSKNNSGRRGTGEVTFLNGLCKCAYCGGYMRTKQKTGSKNKYFVCGNKDSMRNDCKNKFLRIQDVEETVIYKLSNYTSSTISINNSNIDTTLLKKELEKKNSQIKKLVTKISLADDLEDIFLEQIRELKKDVTELEVTIQNAERKNLLNEVDEYNRTVYLQQLKNFKTAFYNCESIQDKRILVKSLVASINLDGINKKIELVPKF
ncbi:recombinase family protein [Clostridium ihumii]|uniref:recombinase family protein n=1 Tax=Clostridium ihumii TaxID=1470356 RepID=UPI00054E7B0B|nr:recombinase family protein [Clostridium ihumii]